MSALLLFCDLLVQNLKFRKFDLTIWHLKTNRCISAAPYRASCWNLTRGLMGVVSNSLHEKSEGTWRILDRGKKINCHKPLRTVKRRCMTPITRQYINRHLRIRDHVFYRRRTSTLHGSLLSRRFKGALSRKETFTGSQRESSTHATIALISTYHTKPTKPLSSGTVTKSVSGRYALPAWRSWTSLTPLFSNRAIILN